MVLVIHFENVEIRGVVTGLMSRLHPGCNVKGLVIEVGIVPDYGEDEQVISHHNLDIVGLSGDSLEVSDGEIDSSSSLIPHEPNQDNVHPVVGWGVVW